MTMEEHLIRRQIRLSAGHRVPLHGSKCRAPHGHGWFVQAVCVGPLAEEGEQTGMVLDFSFLLEEMMEHIHKPCDHAMILEFQDPLVGLLVGAGLARQAVEVVLSQGYATVNCDEPGLDLPVKLYLLPFAPTAENLARHWFGRLAPHVVDRSVDRAVLAQVHVYENPDCRASYPSHL